MTFFLRLHVRHQLTSMIARVNCEKLCKLWLESKKKSSLSCSNWFLLSAMSDVIFVIKSTFYNKRAEVILLIMSTMSWGPQSCLRAVQANCAYNPHGEMA